MRSFLEEHGVRFSEPEIQHIPQLIPFHEGVEEDGARQPRRRNSSEAGPSMPTVDGRAPGAGRGGRVPAGATSQPRRAVP